MTRLELALWLFVVIVLSVMALIVAAQGLLITQRTLRELHSLTQAMRQIALQSRVWVRLD